MNSSTQTTKSEVAIAMPTGVLVATVLATASGIGVIWVVVARLAGYGVPVQNSGLAGAAVVGLVGLVGTLVIGPWKPRPIAVWMTMWLAATVVRLFITPGLTFLLYSTASLNVTALTLSVAGTYLAVLLVEAVVMARHVSQIMDPPTDSSGFQNPD